MPTPTSHSPIIFQSKPAPNPAPGTAEGRGGGTGTGGNRPCSVLLRELSAFDLGDSWKDVIPQMGCGESLFACL